MLILGINAYHGDSSACLLVDGQLVAAVEEERFTRVKHWAGFPAESVRYCLAQGGVTARDLDYVAVSFDPKANLGRKLLFTIANRPSIRSVVNRLKRQGKGLSLKTALARATGFQDADLRAQVVNIEHHDAHIASGFFSSEFEDASILSVDGMGDFVSTVSAAGRGTGFTKLHEVFYPHSLGFLYNAITLYLGFNQYGDEYKVMGLAPYGQPVYLDEFRRIVHALDDGFALNLDYFRHHLDGISMSWDGGSPQVQPFHAPLLEQRLGPALPPRSEMGEREQNIAASLQAVTEEILFHLLQRLHGRTGHENLVLAGGCAMNSVAVGKITRNTPFRRVYVPAGAADNGTCIGAALDCWSRVCGKPRRFQMRHAYWGPEFDDETCITQVRDLPVRATRLEESALLDRVVDALCDGKVVGWFSGRMELGARALGNRSLLADPRRADMRDIINLKIKFREKFRPFAPSVLRERAAEFFEPAEDSPFMERVLPVREDKRSVIPAVTHVDGSGRLQTVDREANPRYHELIRRFGERTGIPILLNTSLNENEPIVHTPRQAADCFLRTRMDLLVLGRVLLERNG